MENIDDEQVKTWMKRQNEFYDSIINNLSGRSAIDKEIKEIMANQKFVMSFPKIAERRIFYSVKNKNQSFEHLIYFDLQNNKTVELHNTAILNEKDSCIYSYDYYEPSYNGKYISFGISPNGDENATIYILDVEKKQLLPEKIKRCRIGNIQWLPDGSGFFYVQDNESELDNSNEDVRVKLHKLRTGPENDKLIITRVLNKNLNLKKDDWPMLYVFPSSEKVLLNVLNASYASVYYANLEDILKKPSETIKWAMICSEEDKMCRNVLHGNYFFGLSFKLNPNGQLIMMKLSDLTSQVLIDASDCALDELLLTRNSLYITSTEKGHSNLVKLNLENYQIKNIELPYKGGVWVFNTSIVPSAYQASDNFMFLSSEYDKQFGVYIYDLKNNLFKTDVYREVQDINSSLDIVIEEIEVPSHDGTLVPLSIIYKKGLEFNGENPTIIDAYGAYGISMKPVFMRKRLVWFKRGGIYAVAHVRGGSEKGDKWYKGGFKATKANSWLDLIACAEYLIKNKYTSSQKLAVTGASAGGITVGRAITERPDLFRAAVIYVGAFNALRMENSKNSTTIGEFGTTKDSLEFQYLYNMDAYHHIKNGVNYPSVLFSASINDARVAPWEPAKGVAKMQEVVKGKNIILFRVEDKGHYSYPSTTDVYSFLSWQFGNPDFKLKTSENMFKPASE